eukprot:m.273285 g.273285  ORF g.273285 m.273285 type:complete len:52 (-) comp106009_c0_seq1:108-263(-)
MPQHHNPAITTARFDAIVLGQKFVLVCLHVCTCLTLFRYPMYTFELGTYAK